MRQTKMIPVLVELMMMFGCHGQQESVWTEMNNKETGPLRSLGLVASVLWNICDPADNRNRELLGKIVSVRKAFFLNGSISWPSVPHGRPHRAAFLRCSVSRPSRLCLRRRVCRDDQPPATNESRRLYDAITGP